MKFLDISAVSINSYTVRDSLSLKIENIQLKGHFKCCFHDF